MMTSYLYVYSTPYCFISLSTQNGSTALLVSSGKGHSEVVKLLLQAGARDLPHKVLLPEIDIILMTLHVYLLPPQSGKTALSLARAEGHTNIVSLLEQYQQ